MEIKQQFINAAPAQNPAHALIIAVQIVRLLHARIPKHILYIRHFPVIQFIMRVRTGKEHPLHRFPARLFQNQNLPGPVRACQIIEIPVDAEGIVHIRRLLLRVSREKECQGTVRQLIFQMFSAIDKKLCVHAYSLFSIVLNACISGLYSCTWKHAT